MLYAIVASHDKSTHVKRIDVGRDDCCSALQCRIVVAPAYFRSRIGLSVSPCLIIFRVNTDDIRRHLLLAQGAERHLQTDRHYLYR